MQPRFEDEWRTRFEEFAELRDDDAGIAGWSATGLDARLRRFLDLWTAAPPGGWWLDAGCGAGTYARILAQNGLHVIGVDYSLPTLRKAATRELGVRGLVAADVRRLPFKREFFEGALCFGVNQALTDGRSAIHEIGLLLKPGGELWVDALNRWCLVHVCEYVRRSIRRRPVHLRYESPRQFVKLLEECGFVDIRLHWMPIAPGRTPGLQRLIEAPLFRAIVKRIPGLGMLISHAFIVQARRPTRLP